MNFEDDKHDWIEGFLDFDDAGKCAVVDTDGNRWIDRDFDDAETAIAEASELMIFVAP